MDSINPTLKRKILIVDDHVLVRQGLRDFIEHEPGWVVCGEAAHCADALKCCAETAPDLALIDLSLGGESGLDLVKDIAVRFPEIKMLVLSMQDEILYSERVLRAGASGYVGKDTTSAVLIEAMRCVLDGGIFATEAVKQKIMKIVKEPRSNRSPISRLSDRELAVFEHIGKGIGTVEIAEIMHLSVKTVETYRARIKTKLGLNNAPELMQRAVQWVINPSD
ncbi:MAG: response regulator transcription factor [Pontiellaceae bacterium]|jgi:DNA-binding NarL/FixJ family response regulator|nr:response regulator transcription factor [Pontiellaceae bacterium]